MTPPENAAASAANDPADLVRVLDADGVFAPTPAAEPYLDQIDAIDDLTLEGSPEQIQKTLVDMYKAEYAREWL